MSRSKARELLWTIASRQANQSLLRSSWACRKQVISIWLISCKLAVSYANPLCILCLRCLFKVPTLQGLGQQRSSSGRGLGWLRGMPNGHYLLHIFLPAIFHVKSKSLRRSTLKSIWLVHHVVSVLVTYISYISCWFPKCQAHLCELDSAHRHTDVIQPRRVQGTRVELKFLTAGLCSWWRTKLASCTRWRST